MLDFFYYEENMTDHITDMVLLIAAHEADIQAQIQKLQKELLHIRQKSRFYNGIKDAIDSGTEWPCWEDYAPES